MAPSVVRGAVGLLAFLGGCATSATVDDRAKKGNGDSGDTGDAPADNSEGSYIGAVEGLNTYQGAETECSGDATLTIDAAGALDGYLTCTFTSGFAQEGVWVGTEADGVIDSTWTDDYGNGYIIDFPGVGTYENGQVVVDFDWADAGIGVTFVGTATLARQ